LRIKPLSWAFAWERVTGIEPALSAWEADVLPLNYTRTGRLGEGGRWHMLPESEAVPGPAASGDEEAGIPGSVPDVLLSDRDIRSEVESGRVKIDPYDPGMVQPSSVDVRLDRYFRVFENHRYPHIDPAVEQPDLTRLVEVDSADPFILHPGEFVLASTYEIFGLPDDLAARLEGKALSVYTPIPTPEGWREMGDLKVGDLVFDENGEPTPVVAATEVMTDRECREIVFSDGQSIIADLDHRWLATTKSARRHNRPAKVYTTREIEESPRKVGGEWNHHIQIAGPVRYPSRDLPVNPYVLGVWLGDGISATAEITVGAGDEQVLDEIRDAGYAVWEATSPRNFRIGGLSRRHNGRTRADKTGRFSSDSSLTSEFRRLNLLGNKHVPSIYLVASIEQRLALLQGLMDSDGYIDDRGRCEFVSTKENLADAVLELAASLGLRPKKRKKNVTLYGADMGVAFQVKFVPHIPVFRLRRKLDRLKQGRFHRFRAIVDVRPVPAQAVRCIEVGAASDLFLAGRTFIPTHNSSLGRLGLLTHSTAGWIDPGFNGHVTLELSNVATLPIKLWPGMKIGQMCLFRCSSPAEHPYGSAAYGSRYQNQRGPTPSRSYLNFHRTKV
jgi:deoxycytidine triphosphate deaminase